MTLIHLVRHGAHDLLGKVLCGRMDGVSLNVAGQAESLKLGQLLATRQVACLYSSPLTRTCETAALLGKVLDLPVETTEALIEIDFGAWTGSRFEALAGQAAWQHWNTARAAARPPGGESIAEVEARLLAWVHEVEARHGSASVAAVSHGDVIKTLLCRALGLSMDQHDRFEIAPASVSTLCAEPWGLRVISMNEVPG